MRRWLLLFLACLYISQARLTQPSFWSKLSRKFTGKSNLDLNEGDGEDHEGLQSYKTPYAMPSESMQTVIVGGVLNMIVSFIYIVGINHIVSRVVPDKSTTVVKPHRLASYLPANCTLNEYELEVLENIIDPKDDIKTKGFDSIGGFSSIKLQVKDFMIDILSYDHEGYSSLKPAQTMLLYGPPGCGKSSMVQASSAFFQLPTICVMPSLLMRKYVGESNQMVKAVFSLANKLQPCILFIDEVDSLLRARSDDDSFTERNVKIEFMQLWDNLMKSDAKVIVFGATNRPQDVDSAVHRRFERSILLAPPNFSDRKEIFKAILTTNANTIRVEDKFDYDTCAQLTDSYSASDILAVCKAATANVQRERLKNSMKGAGKGKDINTSYLLTTRHINGTKISHNNATNSSTSRPLRLSDIEEALKTVYPTAWTSKSYGTLSNE